ncbi:hypothetical protein [Draconibacterium sediminis]|uniref:Uncharacterized protein n=1 Tax=Draconibacterium sediminis TaxID=1544798 RepID=A0A0D8J941_9BACT|nr:hypothetical protein [Draconibacterium sediminis]KJF43239.1 hypothetical protein LH29_13365 [Draconibacterium sediminis]
MRNILIFIATLTFLIACEKDRDISYEGFVPIFEESIYDSLQVHADYDYYEIRNNVCFDNNSYDIVYSEGTKPYTDSVFAPTNEGVYYSQGDLCAYNNIFIKNGEESYFLTSYSEIIEFLGEVDCKGDALFIAHLNGYYFEYNDIEFGIKEDGDGFLIYACKLTSACTPLQIDKFLIKIDIEGNIVVLEQSVLTKMENACI